jgi:hypothetical protein
MGMSQETMKTLLDLYEARIEALERELAKRAQVSGYVYVTSNNQVNE